MLQYKLINAPTGEPVGVVFDGYLSIPFDPDNRDYAEYLKWLAEGNEPLPADEPAA